MGVLIFVKNYDTIHQGLTGEDRSFLNKTQVSEMKKMKMLNELQSSIDYALMHGLLKLNPANQIIHAPFALIPYSLPKSTIEWMVSLTPIFNRLMLRVAEDKDFLFEHLEKVAQSDTFIKDLLALYVDQGQNQPYQLLINRNDFMLVDDAKYQYYPKQVEFNTISVSFPYLASQMGTLHQFLYSNQPLEKSLVPNDPLSGVVNAIAEAVKIYDHSSACMVMVILKEELNTYDQRGIEHQLLEKHRIPTIRMSLEEIAEYGRLNEGHLEIQGKIAAVTYFRAGYSPEHYQNSAALNGRKMIEASSTISVPNIGMQLAGMKKIQQVLTSPTLLQQFVSAEEAQSIKSTFVGLYLLNEMIEGHNGERSAKTVAIENFDKYVLKPQREGGGYNYYGQEIVNHLKSMTEEEEQAYILMERIAAVKHQSTIVVSGQAQEVSCISEVGRYSVCLAEKQKVLFNRDVGYLVRTKNAQQNEGGVSAGYACLNTLSYSA